MISDGILFIIASFQTHQSVYLKGREGLQTQISPSLDAGCVQCAMYELLRYYSDAGNTVLSLVNTPRTLIGGIRGVTVKG